MSGRDDDDKTTATRAKKLRGGSASEAPQRPTVPLTGRGSKLRSAQQMDDFGERPDDAPTMFDPNVPTGARGPTEDGAPDAPYPYIDENEHPSGATVIGKRSAVSGAPNLVGPRPDEPAVPSRAKLPLHFEPMPLDESARTRRWDPPPPIVDAEPTGPALRPPPAPTRPLSPRAAPLPEPPALAAPPLALPLEARPPAQPPLAPPLAAPPLTPRPPILPLAPAPPSEPIRVMSMKAPSAPEPEKQARVVPEVRVRPMAEVRQGQQTPPQGMGFLAPPRDPNEARSRRRADYIIWGSVVVIVAAVVMLAVWFLAR